MKKILITGADSYVGTHVEEFLRQWPERYRTDTVDMTDESWKTRDFSGYDTVFHVAGIAHSDAGCISRERRAEYFRVNTLLAVETAQKAKADGVKQFIFMSSAIVYGDSAPIGKSRVITKDTPVSPSSFYGESKAKAEQGLLPLQDDGFSVVILRCPMIYGKGSKGNYSKLAALARRLPCFPLVENSRSMLYIDNLSQLVRLLVDDGARGIFWPQNSVYTNTSRMVQLIAAAHGKKMPLVKGFTWALKLLSHITGVVSKAFGSLCYDMSLSEYSTDYRCCTLEQSIQLTEK